MIRTALIPLPQNSAMNMVLPVLESRKGTALCLQN